jgi:hypothetical protein
MPKHRKRPRAVPADVERARVVRDWYHARPITDVMRRELLRMVVTYGLASILLGSFFCLRFGDKGGRMATYSYYTGVFALDDLDLQVEFSSHHTDEAGLKQDALSALVAQEPSKAAVIIAIGELASFTFKRIV